jgi:hypothetical protein
MRGVRVTLTRPRRVVEDGEAVDGIAIRIGRRTPSRWVVKVDADLHGQDELETIIHELMHTGLWDLDENAVGEVSKDLAKSLYLLGYRRAGR